MGLPSIALAYHKMLKLPQILNVQITSYTALFLSHVSTLTCDIDITIPYVCLSVRPLRSGILWKWLNVLS